MKLLLPFVEWRQEIQGSMNDDFYGGGGGGFLGIYSECYMTAWIVTGEI